MANNRMLLVHKATGRAFVLAKWYPSSGWHSPVSRPLTEFLDEPDPDWSQPNYQGEEFELAYESEEGLVYVEHDPLVVERKGKV